MAACRTNLQLLVGGRDRLHECRQTAGAAAVQPVRHQAMKVEVEVGGRSEALFQRDCAAVRLDP